jgi:omega-hydroxy-beta-dihydromenaquinone-9 sulfotransferase
LKDSYLTAGVRMAPLFRLLRRNKIAFGPRYIVRVIFLLQAALWSSLFSRLDALRFGKATSSQPLPGDPIFIVGHWRTGSTFLHQILSRDPQLTTPTLFQVAQPESFLISYKYFQPLFNSLVSKHRPMDMVRLGMNEPQEDEYALYRMTRYSPLEGLVFPKSKEYFLNHVTTFLPPEAVASEWDEKLKLFFKRVAYHSEGRIVSKNPFNSLRILHLARLFPGAKFLHIIRNPMDVVPSTIHMWDIVQRQNCLNRNAHRPTVAEVSTGLRKILDLMELQLNELPEEHYIVIRFEDLEQDPLGSLKSVYGKLQLPFTTDFEKNIRTFLSEVSDFKKNSFCLSDEDKAVIRAELKQFMERYRYTG